MVETKHPIQIVSRRTGLSADVIRAWERRYKAVKPSRSDNGRSLHYRDKEDVWEIKREYWTGEEKTPTKLPLEIIEKLLSCLFFCKLRQI